MRIICYILATLISTNVTATEFQIDKLTPELQNKIASLSISSDSTLSLWLTLDVNKVDKIPIVLSEKSIQRRKKVDLFNNLITSSDSTFSQSVIDSLIQLGAEIRHVLYWLNAVTVDISANDLSSLSSFSTILEIDLIRKFSSQRKFDNDSLFETKSSRSKSSALSYGLSYSQNRFIKADKLHASGLSGRGIRIAMFDSGCNTNHPAFDSLNIINTYNFIDNISDVTQAECSGLLSQLRHGTFTLGVIGSYVPDSLIGVAYNAEYLLAKTEITCGNIEIFQEEDNWIAAAQWADQQGADIISSSLGYITFQDSVGYTFADLDGDIPRITTAADIAASKNILVINSAGNERGSDWNHIVTPADGDSVIAVGAVNLDSSLAGFSSPGPSADGRIKPDIVALGTAISAPNFVGGYVTGIGGTSFSAPLVAGSAALAIEHDSTLTADELRDLIRQSGDRYENPDNDFGYGLFDALKTADIIRFLKPYSLVLSIEGVNRFLIETGGRTGVIPTLTLIDTVFGVSFSDNNDGTGYLDINSSVNLKSTKLIRLAADVGYFADTADFVLFSKELLQSKLVVGPNPCSDFLNIYFYDALNFESLTIHAISGEKIWELFNNYTVDADINRIEARWNCDNQTGAVVADGVYVIVVSAGGKQFHQNVLKIK